MTRLCIIADTHEQHHSLKMPPADILVVAGDFTIDGKPDSIEDFSRWLGEQSYKAIVVVAGNHDILFEKDRNRAVNLLQKHDHDTKVIYLEDSGITLDGISFYGSPWQPMFSFGWAFNKRSELELLERFSKIPAGIDVLVIHTPPRNILDGVPYTDPWGKEDLEHCGSVALLKEVMDRVKPRVNCFGHIHSGRGIIEKDGITFVNASCMDDEGNVRQPIVVDI